MRLTAPAAGATVSDMVALVAEASDPDGIASVAFRADGNAVGAPDTSAPYSVEWDATAAGDGPHTLRAVARDTTGTEADAEIQVDVTNERYEVPDPPALSETAPEPFVGATDFLYTGPDAIQVGVEEGTIAPRRAAVLRGRVTTRSGDPLPGVRISVPDHPEYGESMSRDNGEVFLAVNGGGPLTVRYEKPGHLAADRQVDVPWQDYVWLDDVALVQLDDEASEIDLAEAPAEPQVAHGSPVEDADGERQATLLFEPETAAEMVLPDGSVQPLEELTVRATEYTVGPRGEEAMPGPLPPNSGYTYAVEFSVDEADAAGAEEVRFDRPVASYTENFLGFPVGTPVPVGYYDRAQSRWVPAPNGRVVELLAEQDGAAVLDVDGDGEAATQAERDELGVTEGELRRLAELHEPGQSLWRVMVEHFTPYDFNWPWGPPQGARAPMPLRFGATPDCGTCDRQGSIIQTERQVLGEEIPLSGSEISLRYQSDRVPGRTAENTLEVVLTGDTVPAGARAIDVAISVAGRRITDRVDATPNRRYRFTWDGKDRFGRKLPGAVPITVETGFVYDASYQPPSAQAASFAEFAADGGSASRWSVPARQEIVLTRGVTGTVGSAVAPAEDLGGWNLGIRHRYDPVARKLYQGDGRVRSVESVLGSGVLRTIAGTGDPDGALGDGGPATAASLASPEDLAAAPDGSYFVADADHRRIRRIAPDGTISTVAGTGEYDNTGDGGPATAATFRYPSALAVAGDGSLLVLDASADRVRRIAPDGTISTIAGTDRPPPECPPWPEPGWDDCGIETTLMRAPMAMTASAAADDDQATAAVLNDPRAIAVGPDGTVYIAERTRIRKITADGRLVTIAGDEWGGSDGDGGPAVDARFEDIEDIVVSNRGDLFIAEDGGGRVRRIGIDGIVERVAGNGNWSHSGDGGPATEAGIRGPQSLAIAKDGSLYIADSEGRVRVVRSGRITTIAGDGSMFSDRENAPAAAANFRKALGLTLAPDGSWLFADEFSDRVTAVMGLLPGFSGDDIAIPSDDGAEVFQFDKTGVHLRTVNALTGGTVYAFGYDPAGRLTSVRRGEDEVTSIVRFEDGTAAAIAGPYGDTTQLVTNEQGYLEGVQHQGGESVWLEYGSGGLLTSLEDERGAVSRFAYDAEGRLERDEDAAGAVKTLERDAGAESTTVTFRDGAGHASEYGVRRLGDGAERRTMVDPAGGTSEVTVEPDGTRTLTSPGELTRTSRRVPDSRFGMHAPLAASERIVTPGGRALEIERSSTAELANPADPLSLRTLTDRVTVGGHEYSSVFDRASGQMTLTSPEGRVRTLTVDAQDRPLEEREAGTEPITYRYDDRGQLSELAQGERTWRFERDEDGNVVAIVDPLDRRTAYEYDDDGNVSAQLAPGGLTTRYEYDERGDLRSVTPPGRPAHELTVDAVGRPAGSTGAGGASPTSYSWNLDGQLRAIDRPDGRRVELVYDDAGRLDHMVAGGRTTTATYDGTTQRVASVVAGGESVAYEHDGPLLERATAAGAVNGRFDVGYDALLRPATTSVNGAHTVELVYDDDGLLTAAGGMTLERDPTSGRVLGTGLGDVTTSVAHDGYGSVSESSATFGETGLLGFEYGRDDLGRITSVTATGTGDAGAYSYRYDESGRLVEVIRGGQTVATYAYDANGNRVAATGPDGGTVTAEYDNQDRLVRHGTNEYEYTANGEVSLVTDASTGATTRYRYDALGALEGATLPDGTRLDYVLDPLGRRVAVKRDAQLERGFLYGPGGAPVAELDATGAVVSRFVYATRGNVPDWFTRGGRTYRILTDHLGSPRKVVDVDSGEVVQELDYDAYGNVVRDTRPGFQPFGFAGGLYDRDTRLTHFGAREYDASTGRWTARDPIGFAGGDSNLYGYVLGDPVNFVDPSGLKIWDDAFELAAGAVDGLGLTDQRVVDSAAGFGDGASGLISGTVGWFSFGHIDLPTTRDVRMSLGIDDVVDHCSIWYRGSSLLGGGAAMFTPLGIGKAVQWGFQAAGAVVSRYFPKLREALRAIQRWYKSRRGDPNAWKKYSAKHQKVFYKAYPHLAGKLAAVHHAIPQAIFRNWPHLYNKSVKDSLDNLRGIPNTDAGKEAHNAISNHWNEIIRLWKKGKYEPSREEIELIVDAIDRQYGRHFRPRR